MNSTLWLPLALVSALLTAFTALSGKLGVASVNSTTATFVRSAAMLATIVIFMALSGKFSSDGLTTKSIFWLAVSGVTGALTWLFFFWSLKVGAASKVVPIDNLSLIFAVVLAAVFLREQVSWPVGLGATIMVIGATLVALG